MSDAAKTEKPEGKSKKPMMIGAVVVVAALAGGGYWFMAHPKAAAAKESKDVEPEESGEKALLALEPFVVNLADEGGGHFLRANIQLIIDAKEAEAAALQEKKVETMPLRSAVLELLSQQKAATLVTPEGKEALKEAIKKRASEVFKKHKVKEVLFSEFVVQF
jgi:flagellar FliL protein